MEEISELLAKLNISEKLFDIEAFREIVGYFIEKENLSDYIYDVVYKNVERDEAMAYSPAKKIITINFEHYYEIMNQYKEAPIIIFNALFLLTILHEIAHAIQFKKIFEGSNDFETNLLKLCFVRINYDASLSNPKSWSELFSSIKEVFVYAPKFDKFYLNNLDIFPSERLAEIYASSHCRNWMTQYVPKDNLDNLYFTHLCFGYDFSKKISSPTERFISLYCKKRFYKPLFDSKESLRSIFEQTKCFSIEDRLKYGLEVKEEDFERVKQLIKCKSS